MTRLIFDCYPVTIPVSKLPRPPAKTAAERQKAYRERRAREVGEQRINTWVAAAAVHALNALAKRQGVTQKVMLERLLLEAAVPKAKTAQAAKVRQAADRSTKTARSARAVTAGSSKPSVKKPVKASQANPPGASVKRAKAKVAKAIPHPVQASLWDD